MVAEGFIYVVDRMSEIPTWTVLSAGCLALLYVYGSYPMKTWKRLGVPGPPPIPFFGNALQIFYVDNDKARANIEKLTKKYGKIVGIHLFRQPTLIVTDLEATKEICVTDFSSFNERYNMSDDESFQNSLQDSLPFQKGDAWKRNKKIVSPSFTGSKLKLLTNYMNTTARQLTDKLGDQVDEGDMVQAQQVFGAFALDVFTGTAFGFNLDTQHNIDNAFFRNSKKIFNLGFGAKLAMFVISAFPFLSFITKVYEISIFDRERLEFYRNEARTLLKERKSDPDKFKTQSDILQNLIHAELDPASNLSTGSNKLTSEEVVSNTTSFFLGGFETTAMTMQFVSYVIAKFPDVQRKLVEEIERVVGIGHDGDDDDDDDDKEESEISYEMCQNLHYMDAVLYETLRVYPPVVLNTRVATRNTTLKGYPVPKGTVIFNYLGNICKDPDVFENPETFNPDRFLSNSNNNNSDGGVCNGVTSTGSASTSTAAKSLACLPFGLGPRQCIGMRLSMLEMKIALVHMLRKFQFVDVSPRDLVMDDLLVVSAPSTPVELKLVRK